MIQELKPCPFCGNQAHLVDDLITFHVQCDSCSATGPVSSYLKGAAESWNTRALTQRPAAQTDSMGMPTSCGKPLCSPDEHHPLCKLHKPVERPAAQEVDDGDVTGQPGPLPETGWDEVPEGAFRKPSPTAGMNLGERIKHVGGRENAAGYIEFGSVAAVRALVRQYLRDLPAPQQATHEPVGEPVQGEFFAFDQDGGIAFYKTRQEAIDHANESLKYYQQGAADHNEWDEDVDEIRWGVVMQRAKATNISATEDGESSCDYELQDVATRPTPVETEPVGETWGWAIEDKHGVAQAIRPARKEFFGCVQSSEPFTAEDVSKMDCEWAGLAPHRIVTLFTHPAPGVPDGFALVPVDPTPEMISAAQKVGAPGALRAAWSRMLAAAQAKGGV